MYDIEKLREEIHQTSEEISDLKKGIFRCEKAKKYAWIDEDGNAYKGPMLTYEEFRNAGYKNELVEYDKVASCINPGHEKWEHYRFLKDQVSVRLTALHIAKGNASKIANHFPACAGREFLERASTIAAQVPAVPVEAHVVG